MAVDGGTRGVVSRGAVSRGWGFEPGVLLVYFAINDIMLSKSNLFERLLLSDLADELGPSARDPGWARGVFPAAHVYTSA